MLGVASEKKMRHLELGLQGSLLSAAFSVIPLYLSSGYLPLLPCDQYGPSPQPWPISPGWNVPSLTT